MRRISYKKGKYETANSGSADGGAFETAPLRPFCSNRVVTSRYNKWTFLPLFLWEQFTRPTNIYFCCIFALQCIRDVSISNGLPTIGLPLGVVLAVTAAKDLFEDVKRQRQDREQNERKYQVRKGEKKDFVEIESQYIVVGDIVKVTDNRIFPADMLLIHTEKGEDQPFCYVETSNIDGETNLKLKQVPQPFNTIHAKGFEPKWTSFGGNLVAEAPSGDLDSFTAHINDQQQQHQISESHLLIRGSELRNTGFIYGLVIYTGFESKIFMNGRSRAMRKIKRSRVERMTNRIIFTMACFQATICLVCTILYVIEMDAGGTLKAWYLQKTVEQKTDGIGTTAIARFFTWFIIYAQFIPISLLVTMEMTKFCQAVFMGWDIKMAYRTKDGIVKFCQPNNSGLNEELGQIEFCFSDKTGTLTENSLDFRKCVIGTGVYGTGDTEIGKAARRRAEGDKFVDEDKEFNAHEKVEVFAAGGEWRPAKFTGRMRMNTVGNLLEVQIDHEKKEMQPEDVRKLRDRCPNVNFDADSKERILRHLNEYDRNTNDQKEPDDDSDALLTRLFFTGLALNNDCFPVVKRTKEESGKEGDIVMNKLTGRPRYEFRASSPDDNAMVSMTDYIGVTIHKREPPFIHLRLSYGLQKGSAEEGPIEKWKELALLAFNSDRKRMSIICEHPTDGHVYVFMKGADNVMRDMCGSKYASAKSRQVIDSNLQIYAEEGLRTLLCAYARHPQEWWHRDWKPKYEEMTRKLGQEQGEDKQRVRDELYERLERHAGCQLIGCTAIEDKLQDGVPETIAGLLTAGIRVWVLTGDKMETAINIAMACNLLEPDMEHDPPLENKALFRIASENSQQLDRDIKESLKRQRAIKSQFSHDDMSLGLIVTSKAYKKICEREEKLMDNFVELAVGCNSVVGCRLQPNQKAQMIRMMSNYYPKMTSMAVGDGANDEPMIRQAHVGIGIAGVEGTAAVRASDYAIARFKFLSRLVFVHGRLNYRRVTGLVNYMLYKNAVVAMTTFWFGFYMGFSGQQQYQSWTYQLYNPVYSAFPVIFFGVWDFDIRPETLEKYPQIYKLSTGGRLFNVRRYFRWLLDAIFTSILVSLIPIYTFSSSTTIFPDGQSYGIVAYGLTTYNILVIVVNVRIAFEMMSWHYGHHIVIWGTIMSFTVFAGLVFNYSWLGVNSIAGMDLYGIMRIYGTWRFWLVTVASALMPLLIVFAIQAYVRLFAPSELDLWIRADSRPSNKKKVRVNAGNLEQLLGVCGRGELSNQVVENATFSLSDANSDKMVPIEIGDRVIAIDGELVTEDGEMRKVTDPLIRGDKRKTYLVEIVESTDDNCWQSCCNALRPREWWISCAEMCGNGSAIKRCCKWTFCCGCRKADDAQPSYVQPAPDGQVHGRQNRAGTDYVPPHMTGHYPMKDQRPHQTGHKDPKQEPRYLASRPTE